MVVYPGVQSKSMTHSPLNFGSRIFMLTRSLVRPALAWRAAAGSGPVVDVACRRSFTTSTRAYRSFQDANDPRLFYHSADSSNRFNLSFLAKPSPPRSPTYIGSVPATSSSSANGGGGAKAEKGSGGVDGTTMIPAEVTPSAFEENPEWMELVHAILAVRFTESVTLQTLAKARLEEGYIHILGAFVCRHHPSLSL
jgi:hypothetical protein